MQPLTLKQVCLCLWRGCEHPQAQARRYRAACWDVLLRPGARGAGGAAAASTAVLPLPDWLGAPGPGLVAGQGIPLELRGQYRVDP